MVSGFIARLVKSRSFTLQPATDQQTFSTFKNYTIFFFLPESTTAPPSVPTPETGRRRHSKWDRWRLTRVTMLLSSLFDFSSVVFLSSRKVCSLSHPDEIVLNRSLMKLKKRITNYEHVLYRWMIINYKQNKHDPNFSIDESIIVNNDKSMMHLSRWLWPKANAAWTWNGLSANEQLFCWTATKCLNSEL